MKYPRPHESRETEVFVNLPSGPISVKELNEALARLTEGVASWSDVRVTREAIEYLGSLVRHIH
jgi:hypothetical protein